MEHNQLEVRGSGTALSQLPDNLRLKHFETFGSSRYALSSGYLGEVVQSRGVDNIPNPQSMLGHGSC